MLRRSVHPTRPRAGLRSRWASFCGLAEGPLDSGNHLSVSYIFDDDGFSDAGGEDEAASSGFIFLVAAGGVEQLGNACAEAGQRSIGADGLVDACGIFFREECAGAADVERGEHAPRDGFSVEKLLVA